MTILPDSRSEAKLRSILQSVLPILAAMHCMLYQLFPPKVSFVLMHVSLFAHPLATKIDHVCLFLELIDVYWWHILTLLVYPALLSI